MSLQMWVIHVLPIYIAPGQLNVKNLLWFQPTVYSTFDTIKCNAEHYGFHMLRQEWQTALRVCAIKVLLTRFKNTLEMV